MTLILAVVSCLASGYFLVALGWPRNSWGASALFLRASLSVGYGIGAWSVIFFFARIIGASHLIAIDLIVMALLAVAFFWRRAHFVEANPRASCQKSVELPIWLDRVLKIAFAVVFCAALYSTVLRSIVHPHGEGWDAFAIWNLHARFLFRAGDHWRDGFSPLIPWSHPDYPLLLPGAVAHFWTALGRESTSVPAIIGVAFSFATVGLLVSSLAILCGKTSAMLGGLALLSTPFFVEQGLSQYADIPLSFFFLATMVLLQLYSVRNTDEPVRPRLGLLILAGLAVGFAVWTKNEGMLYLCATLAAQALVFIFGDRAEVRSDERMAGLAALKSTNRVKAWVTLATFFAAIAPFLLLVLWFKHSVTFSSELFSNQAALSQKVLDSARYWTIVQWYGKEFLRFGEWWPVPGTVLLAALYFLLRNRHKFAYSPATRASAWTLALTLAGYFAIYVITPYDLYWHLRFSLNRLFLQLWPCTIFLLFTAIPLGLAQKSQNEPDLLKINAFSAKKSASHLT
jgi:hypothetical protein